MCRNSSGRTLGKGVFWKILVFFTTLLSMLITIAPAFAESFNISLLPGDSNTKVTIEAVKALNNDYPEVKGRIKFQI